MPHSGDHGQAGSDGRLNIRSLTGVNVRGFHCGSQNVVCLTTLPVWTTLPLSVRISSKGAQLTPLVLAYWKGRQWASACG